MLRVNAVPLRKYTATKMSNGWASLRFEDLTFRPVLNPGKGNRSVGEGGLSEGL